MTAARALADRESGTTSADIEIHRAASPADITQHEPHYVPDFARPRFTSNGQERKIADAVAAAPDLYTVIEENDRVRILVYVGGTGSKSEMHEHPDLVAIALTDAHVRFTLGNGETRELEIPAGAAMFDPAAWHSTEVLSGESRVILVELR